ncbi:MAG: hypothetical protein M1816_006509 [Peltula sp. TS41687]|nr:MAG: hypothetical protein M1816_006509 [Peltula sp. TS41687]
MTRRSSTLATKKRTSTQAMAVAAPSRASKRLKSTTVVSQTTKPRSNKHNGLKEQRGDQLQDSDPHDDDDQDESSFEGEKEILSDSGVDEEDEDEDDMYDERNLKIRQRKSQPAKREAKSMATPGTAAGSGRQVVVRIPKPMEAGDTPYEDHTIHPNTFLFLKDLVKNNRRDWLKMHDVDFRTSEKDFDSFAEAVTEKIIEFDETIPQLPIKDIKFRIYRDIRFTRDPTPYKVWLTKTALMGFQ